MEKDEFQLDGIDFNFGEIDAEELEEKFINFEIGKSDYIKINSINNIKTLKEKIKYLYVTTIFIVIITISSFFCFSNVSYRAIENKILVAEFIIFIIVILIVFLKSLLHKKVHISKLRKSIKEEIVQFQFLITMDKIFYRVNGILKSYDIKFIKNVESNKDFFIVHFKEESIVIPLSGFSDSKEATRYVAYINSLKEIKEIQQKYKEQEQKYKAPVKKLIWINIGLIIFSWIIIVQTKEDNQFIKEQLQIAKVNYDTPCNESPKVINNRGITTAINVAGSTNAIAANMKTESEAINPYSIANYISENAFNKDYNYSAENIQAKNALTGYLEKIKNNENGTTDKLQWSKSEGLSFINNPMNKSTLTGKYVNYILYFENMNAFESCVPFYSKNPVDTLSDCNNAIEGAAAYLSQIGTNGKFYNELLEGLQGMVALNQLSKSSNDGCNEVMKLEEEMSYTSTMNYLNKNYKDLNIENIGVIELGQNNILYRYVASNNELYKLYENGNLEKLGSL